MQGRSFTDALKGNPKPADWREAVYYRYWMHMAHGLQVPAHFGIRGDRYKLIFFYGCNPDGSGPKTPAAWELYDTCKDPLEMNNLYGDPEYDRITKDMKAELKRVRTELNETDDDYPKVQQIISKHWNKN